MQILKSSKTWYLVIVAAYTPLIFMKNEVYLFFMNYLYFLYVL